jgi:hypothetical protein
MDVPVICPQCGARHAGNPVDCRCGHTFIAATSGQPSSRPSEEAATPTEQPAKPERGLGPFEVFLYPLKSPHPVSHVCPKCGASEYKPVKSEAMLAYAADRECRVCSTRYTPPTPAWARWIFGVIGVAALAAGVYLLSAFASSPRMRDWKILLGTAWLTLVGVGCFYKAVTKEIAAGTHPEMQRSPELNEVPGPGGLVGGIAAMLVGLVIVLLAGTLLHFAERAGSFVLFPFAGRLIILLGGCGVGGALGLIVYRAGSRLGAGLRLGTVSVLCGLGLYGFGLAFEDQLGTPIFMGIGLLTTLVGLIIAGVAAPKADL